MKIVNNLADKLPAFNAFHYTDGDEYDDYMDAFMTAESRECEIDGVIAGNQRQRGLGIAIPGHIERKIARFTASPWGGRVYETYISRGAPVDEGLASDLWDILVRYGECVIITIDDDVYIEKTSSALPIFDSRGKVVKVMYRDEDDRVFDVAAAGAQFRYVSMRQPIFGQAAITSIARLWTISAAGVLAAEVYHSPARYLLNVDPDELTDVSAAIGRTIAIGPPPDGEPEAKVQELAGGNPKIFDDLSASESSRLALATGVPVSALTPSVVTNMSHETTLLAEKGFIDRVRSLQNLVTYTIKDLTGEAPAFGYVQQQQLSAVADGITKLVAAGVLAADSDFVKKALQMTKDEAEDNATKLASGSPTLQQVVEATMRPSQEEESTDMEVEDNAGTV